MSAKSTVLITGASAGIGAVYADRFARRGHDLVLVARDGSRLNELAARLRREAGVEVEALRADLIDEQDLGRVEQRLRDDGRIGILVNNAGALLRGDFLGQSDGEIAGLIALNITALTRLAHAAASRFAAKGGGAIINLGSIVGLAPEYKLTLYGATKAFVHFLTQGLNLELGAKGVYVQAVLPSATRTELWKRSGRDIDALPAAVTTEEMVDAALVGFDRHETVTIPSLPDAEQWSTYEAARSAMVPNLMQSHTAERYRAAR